MKIDIKFEEISATDKYPIILMCGVSGSGKTFLSRKFEKDGYVRLSSDEMVLDKFGKEFHDLSFETQKDIFLKTHYEITEDALKLLKSGERVVVDSTLCKRFKRDYIRNKCISAGFSPLIVYLNFPFSVLRERIMNRKGTGPNDQIVEEWQLKNFCRNFEKPEADEEYVEIILPLPPG